MAYSQIPRFPLCSFFAFKKRHRFPPEIASHPADKTNGQRILHPHFTSTFRSFRLIRLSAFPIYDPSVIPTSTYYFHPSLPNRQTITMPQSLLLYRPFRLSATAQCSLLQPSTYFHFICAISLLPPFTPFASASPSLVLYLPFAGALLPLGSFSQIWSKSNLRKSFSYFSPAAKRRIEGEDGAIGACAGLRMCVRERMCVRVCECARVRMCVRV